MPAFITGVEDGLGRAAAAAMLRTGGEVRVWLDAERSSDDDARAWRAQGYKAAIGTNDDEGRLEAALEQVHTVVHLAGGALDDPGESTDALGSLASAAMGAGCQRFIWVTDLAVEEAPQLERAPGYVVALTQRIALVRELPMDVVIVKTALRYGRADRLTQLLSQAMLDAAVPHAPVWLGDVAGAVVAADAQRGAAVNVVLEIELVGPDQVLLPEVCEGLQRARGAVNDLGVQGEHIATVEDLLRIPAVGGPDALGKEGTTFAEGLTKLS